jgi:kexin
VELVEQAGELKNHWLLRTEKRPSLGLSSREATETDHVLARFDSLQTRAASHRSSYFSLRSTDTRHARRVVSAVKYLSRQVPRKRTNETTALFTEHHLPSAGDDIDVNTSSRALHYAWASPIPYLVNNGILSTTFPQHMMNVTPVWEMGLHRGGYNFCFGR